MALACAPFHQVHVRASNVPRAGAQEHQLEFLFGGQEGTGNNNTRQRERRLTNIHDERETGTGEGSLHGKKTISLSRKDFPEAGCSELESRLHGGHQRHSAFWVSAPSFVTRGCHSLGHLVVQDGCWSRRSLVHVPGRPRKERDRGQTQPHAGCAPFKEPSPKSRPAPAAYI